MRRRVFLVEDSAAVREEIGRILAGEHDVVGFADDGRLAMVAVEAHRPEVILLDISLPGVSGMALLPLLRAALPSAAIVMLTNHTSEQYVQEAFRRGADSYVLKGEAHQRLLPAIRRGRTNNAAMPAGSPLRAPRAKELLPG